MSSWAEEYRNANPQRRAYLRQQLAKNAIMGVKPTPGAEMKTETDEQAPVVEQVRVYTAHERCDRCGAQAGGHAELPNDAGELLFCDHHLREQAPALEEFGARVFGLEVFSS